MVANTVTALKGPLTSGDILAAMKHLPSAPRVLPRLKQLLSDGNAAVHEIVALIRFDAGISARVLRVSNSIYHSKGVQCLTIEEAVGRVGYDQVYQLVSYAVASQVLVRSLVIYGLEADELWRQSVAGALAAEQLAEHLGEDRDVSYTIGLLHCVGMVAIDEWALRHARHLRFPIRQFPLEATESEGVALGFTHAEAGGALLRSWGFPPAMAEPVRWQYTPQSAGDQSRMADLLFLAKWLRSAVCAGDPKAWPSLPDASYLQQLSLDPEQLEAMVAKVAARLEEVSSLLDTGSRKVSAGGLFPSEQWKRQESGAT